MTNLSTYQFILCTFGLRSSSCEIASSTRD